MKILTLEYKNKEKFERMKKIVGERVLHTLEIEYKGEILGYLIAYKPLERR